MMYVCIPTMNRWENNPIYEKIIKHARHKERFLLFVRDTDESFASRCVTDTQKRHQFIMEILPEKFNTTYHCEEWLSIVWNDKRKFPVFKLIHSQSPVPRVRLNFETVEKILEES